MRYAMGTLTLSAIFLVLVAACGSPSPTRHTSAHHAQAAASASAQAAVTAECAQFSTIYSNIQAATSRASTVGALYTLVPAAKALQWSQSLTTAAGPPASGPAGAAALAIDKAAFGMAAVSEDLSLMGGSSGTAGLLTGSGRIRKAWNTTVSALGDASNACSSL